MGIHWAKAILCGYFMILLAGFVWHPLCAGSAFDTLKIQCSCACIVFEQFGAPLPGSG